MRVRAGAQALSLLSAPFNVEVLTALADGPRPRAEIRRVLGHPPETTMRAHLKRLDQLGILVCRRQGGFPGSMDLALAPSGKDLLPVVKRLETWLRNAPGGPIDLGTVAAKSSTKALLDGWSTGMLRVLAAQPLSLTELDGLIVDVTYPSLERRLVAMRGIGLLRALSSGRRGTPHAVTPWLRSAVLPLVSAARWENRHLEERRRITQRDIEAVFLLALPLIRLPEDASGSCRLVVEVGVDGRDGFVEMTATFAAGRLQSAGSRFSGRQDASVVGSPAAWISAVLDGGTDTLEISGDVDLATAILAALSSSRGAPLRQLAPIQTTH